MARFITADWHLGETRFQIMQRPEYESAQAMVDALVTIHNEIVAPTDEVIVVGNAVSKDAPQFLEQIKRFNGVKRLIRGNHDAVFTDEQLAPYFEEIIPEGGGHLVMVESKPCWVTHYPTQAKPSVWNLVGHVHSAWKLQLNAINVGVDANHFRPYNLDVDIPFLMNAVANFYDEDVWAAYHESNLKHLNLRGKPGRYWEHDGPAPEEPEEGSVTHSAM